MPIPSPSFLATAICASAALARAGDAPQIAPGAEAPEQRWAVHAQYTDILQAHPAFHAAYSGGHSLVNEDEIQNTQTADLFFIASPWEGAEIGINGEAWQGFGLSNALGVAGYPNGDAFKVGNKHGNLVIARAFFRQTLGFGGEQEEVDADLLTLRGKRDISRLTFTIGKIAAGDIFDNNTYSHDPRSQFLNWALMDMGSWDFSADSLGYIPGAVLDLNQKAWAIRGGVFMVPRVQNGLALDGSVTKGYQGDLELEGRFTAFDHPGRVRLLGFLTHAHGYNYGEVSDSLLRGRPLTPGEYRYRYGIGLNMEQEITGDLGMFARLGWGNGQTESVAFTEIDETVSLGFSLKGSWWNRKSDTVGLAGVVNGISHEHQRALDAGAQELILGDGRLRYGTEDILETYYRCKLVEHVDLTLDYQFVNNPGYNRDRGPASIFGARLHLEF